MSGDKTSPFIETMSRRSHRVWPPLKLRAHADDPLPTHPPTHTASDHPLTPVISTLSNHTPHSVPLSFTLLSAVDFPRSPWFQENIISPPGIFLQTSLQTRWTNTRCSCWRVPHRVGRDHRVHMESSLEFSSSLGSLSSPLSRCRTFKVLVIGDSGVGKTCLTHRFCAGEFPRRMEATIGVDFRERVLDVDGEKIKVTFLQL